MVKYINMSKDTSTVPLSLETQPKKFPNVVIAFISFISGLAVLGISSTFLGEINQNGSGGAKQQDDFPRESGNNQLFVVLISMGIVAVVLQLIISVGFWYWKDKESKFLVWGFAIGQSIIQTVLLICLGLFVNQFISLKSNADVPEQSKRTNSTGHGFWIILSANVIFHIGAILYLIHLVMKRSDEEQMEEMAAVVIHRRVPSRIPSEKAKRHGRMQK